MKNSSKEKYEKKIKELEERIQKLEKETGAEETTETSAAEILGKVGRMFGLDGILKNAEKLPEFQERLKEVDKELKRKLKTVPLKGTKERIPDKGRGFRQRATVRNRTGTRKEAPAPRERELDIFDEVDYVLVIIEIPGADEKSVKINLEKDKLTVFADKAGKKYHKVIILPCIPKGKMTKSYKNGILEVKIIKNAK